MKEFSVVEFLFARFACCDENDVIGFEAKAALIGKTVWVVAVVVILAVVIISGIIIVVVVVVVCSIFV